MPGVFNAKSSTGHDLPAITDQSGIIRLLAAMPSGAKIRPNLFGSAAAPAVLPDSKLAVFDRTHDVPIMDQGQRGSCVGHGSDSGVMLCRAQAGMTFQLLSPTWIYAHINGGRDAGSAPSDAVDFLEKVGTCLMSECPEKYIFTQQIPNVAALQQTASRFRLSKVYQIDGTDFGQRLSAAMLGFHLIDCVNVGNNFMQIGPDGVPAASRGVGNHCVCGGEALKKLPDGRWAIKYRNSWSTQFGQGGFMWLTEDHFSHQPQCECFAVQVISEDPQDPAALSDPIA